MTALPKDIPIASVVILPDLLPRKFFDHDVIERYAEIFDDLPPIMIQSGSRTLIDGRYRMAAAEILGRSIMGCIDVECGNSDISDLAMAANIEHGEPLTLSERVAAAHGMIERHAEWTNAMIAKASGLSVRYILRIRDSRESHYIDRHGIKRRRPSYDSDALAEPISDYLTRLIEPGSTIKPTELHALAKDPLNILHNELDWGPSAGYAHRIEQLRRMLRSIRNKSSVEFIHDPDCAMQEQGYAHLGDVSENISRADAALSVEIARVESAIKRACNIAASLGMLESLSDQLSDIVARYTEEIIPRERKEKARARVR